MDPIIKKDDTALQSDYQIRQQRKIEDLKRLNRNRNFKKALKIAPFIFAIGGIGWFISTIPSVPETDIIARQGLHWHSELSIVIEGEKQEVPADIGIGATHNPIHTHDASGVIHMEFSGLVKKDNLKLGQFFKIWNKQFNSNCIFDYCNSQERKIKMSVNGQPNADFENYIMRDQDKIEIIYE